MTETQLLAAVRDLAWMMGARTYHTHRSDRSEPGWPDLVIAFPGYVMFRELKTNKGRLTAAQREWLALLAEAGQDVSVWRPADLSRRIPDELRAARSDGKDMLRFVYRDSNGGRWIPNGTGHWWLEDDGEASGPGMGLYDITDRFSPLTAAEFIDTAGDET